MRLFFALVVTICTISELAYADLDHRKATATIHVVDQHGKPCTTEITIKMLKHAFLFGANNSGIKDSGTLSRYKEIFNSINMLTYWILMDSGARGRYINVAQQQYLMNQFCQHNLHLSAHPLLYNLPAVQPTWIKDWMAEYQYYMQWWYSTFNKVSVVDVLNEPYHQPIADNLAPYIWAKQYAPNVARRVNEYGLITGEILEQWIPVLNSARDYYEVIGVQSHIIYPKALLPSIDQMRRNLQKITALGKPVHITELSIPSAAKGWTEEAQHDYLIQLYTMFFETAGVDAVYYWDLSDIGAWNPTSGLWKADGQVKPAWLGLYNLVNKKWNSSATIRVTNGSSFFNGFKGTYQVNGKEFILENDANWYIIVDE